VLPFSSGYQYCNQIFPGRMDAHGEAAGEWPARHLVGRVEGRGRRERSRDEANSG
jgi:hypothetical protein